MTKAQYFKKVGVEPTDDDLDRVNCPKAGQIGHLFCGWCHVHDQPRFMCSPRFMRFMHPAQIHFPLSTE